MNDDVALGKITVDYELSNSLLAASMGKSTWQTPNEVLQNCHKALMGENIRTETTSRQEVGNVLEKPLIRLAQTRIGLLDIYDEVHKPVRHKNVPLNGSIDAIGVADNIVIKPNIEKGFYLPENKEITLNGKGIIEIKVTSVFPETVPIDSRGVLQCKGLMACAEFDWAALCIAYGTDYRIFFYKRDKKWEEKTLVPHVIDFNKRIKDLDYYSPFNTNDANNSYPFSSDRVVELPEDAEQILDLLKNAQENIKDLEKTVDRYKTTIMSMMKEASIGRIKDYVVNWKTVRVKEKEEHTKVIPARESYTYRKFTVKKIT